MSNHRTLQNFEDVGIIAYMGRNGLEKESNKYNMAQTLKDFNQLASCHPQLIEEKQVVSPVLKNKTIK